MRAPAPAVTVVHVALGNATLLSALYLGVGLGAECLRRVYPVSWVNHLLFALDALPAQVLEHGRLLRFLQDAYHGGAWPEGLTQVWVRAVFQATTVLVIFCLAFVVAGLTFALRGVFWRRRPGAG